MPSRRAPSQDVQVARNYQPDTVVIKHPHQQNAVHESIEDMRAEPDVLQRYHFSYINMLEIAGIYPVCISKRFAFDSNVTFSVGYRALIVDLIITGMENDILCFEMFRTCTSDLLRLSVVDLTRVGEADIGDDDDVA